MSDLIGRKGGRGRKGRNRPGFPAHPAYASESQPEPQLEFSLLEPRLLWESARRETERRRNRIDRVASGVDRHGGGDGLRLSRVEDVLELANDLGLHVAVKRHEARVTHVDVVAVRQIHRVAADKERP